MSVTMIENSNSHSNMLAEFFNSRRFSPLVGILLIVLILYSVNILRRIRIQKSAQNYNIRRKRDLFQDTYNTLFDSETNENQLEEKIGLYVITPTYPRPEQLPELTRLSQTLMHVENILWIVAEDAKEPTYQVVELLERLKPTLPNVYLLAPMPDFYRENKDEYHLPKGVSNRNKGLEWILNFGVD